MGGVLIQEVSREMHAYACSSPHLHGIILNDVFNIYDLYYVFMSPK